MSCGSEAASAATHRSAAFARQLLRVSFNH
jgi:hypothetical protein